MTGIDSSRSTHRATVIDVVRDCFGFWKHAQSAGVARRRAAARHIAMSAADRALGIPELVWAVVSRLDAVDAARVASTSTALREIVLADEVWRPRVRALWRQHAYINGVPSELGAERADEAGEWWAAWTFIGRFERTLGFWASNEPFKGRLLRISLDRALPSEGGEQTLRDRLYIRADHVDIFNAFDASDSGDHLPPIPHAAHWDQSSSSYMCVATHFDCADPTACRLITMVRIAASRLIFSRRLCSTRRSRVFSRPTVHFALCLRIPTRRRSTSCYRRSRRLSCRIRSGRTRACWRACSPAIDLRRASHRALCSFPAPCWTRRRRRTARRSNGQRR